MVLGLLGNKIGMTHIFDTDGNVIPVTIIRVGPCYVTQVKTKETDGYSAVQLGYHEISKKHCKNPQASHFEKLGIPLLRYCKEYRDDSLSYDLGQQVTCEMFQIGQKVCVTAKSIGKGFAGNQKRHNFSRGPMTHGSKNHRAPGSIGAGTTPGRVFKGKKMAGQLGNRKVSISNLEIVKVDPTKHFLVVKGSIPGKIGNLVSIQ